MSTAILVSSSDPLFPQVNIINNNLGTVYTLQARELLARAEKAPSKPDADQLREQAEGKFDDAVTCYRHAVEDARVLCAGAGQLRQSHEDSRVLAEGASNTLDPSGDVEAPALVQTDGMDEGACLESLNLQLMNRMFNLALCLLARGSEGESSESGQGGGAPASIAEARELIRECEELAAERRDAVGDERRVEYLIALASLERASPGRHKEASEALQKAEGVVADYRGDSGDGVEVGKRPAVSDPTVSLGGIPRAVLRQRLLVAYGEESAAEGELDKAVQYWDEAVVGCEGRMDVSAVRKALFGLWAQALAGRSRNFSRALERGLGVRRGGGASNGGITGHDYIDAIHRALARLEREHPLSAHALLGQSTCPDLPSEVDLCFVMDCTGSVSVAGPYWGSWPALFRGESG